MHRKILAGVAASVAAISMAAASQSWASTSYVVPTTTLAAQVANNTSAAGTFTTQSNGNRGAGNISKVDIHTLLYPGATTKVYAHLMLWFGGSNHMNVGYNSDSAAQVQSQIDDMVSRGLDGVIVDWYGQNNSIDQAAQLVMAEAEKHPGFSFAIMIDEGAIQWYSCAGCSPQQALVSDLQYIEKTYFPSPAYMTIEGQPVVTNFNIDLSYSVDWNAANSALSTKPVYIFQNNTGFTHVLSGGSYSWVMPTTTDYGMSYLTSFYDAGLTYPQEQTVGAGYKGFNDTLASWGSNRIMSQQCGQTWLQTFSELNNIYNAGKPLPYLQLVTWNDYEEATELESGIDNCVTLAASAKANSLQWTIAGNENTVDHYTVYISSDGQNLMPLTDIAAGVSSLNLCGFPIPDGSYQMFVQAVGKPSVATQITGAVGYNATCGGTGTTPTPTLNFSASPAALTIPAGFSGTFTVTAKPESGSFNNPIALSCSGVPAALTCSFYPASITPGSGTVTSTLTISAAPVARMAAPQGRNTVPIYAGLLLPLGCVGFAFSGKGKRRSGLLSLSLSATIALGLMSASCGGKMAATSTVAAAPASYSVTIQGNAASTQLSTTVNIVVQ
jgi:hypothetical protein